MLWFLLGLLSRSTCSADPLFLRLLLALSHCCDQLFSAVLVSLGSFPLAAHWENIPQILVTTNCALLRLAYCAPFSLVNSADSITCFCALRKNVLGLSKMCRNPCWAGQIVVSPTPKKKEVWWDSNSRIGCDGKDGLLFFFLQYLGYSLREKLSWVNFSLFLHLTLPKRGSWTLWQREVGE